MANATKLFPEKAVMDLKFLDLLKSTKIDPDLMTWGNIDCLIQEMKVLKDKLKSLDLLREKHLAQINERFDPTYDRILAVLDSANEKLQMFCDHHRRELAYKTGEDGVERAQKQLPHGRLNIEKISRVKVKVTQQNEGSPK